MLPCETMFLFVCNRTAIELEKKTSASNLDQRQILEKNMVLVARELEKLQAQLELANAEKRAREAAAPTTATATTNPSNDLFLSCSLPSIIFYFLRSILDR